MNEYNNLYEYKLNKYKIKLEKGVGNLNLYQKKIYQYKILVGGNPIDELYSHIMFLLNKKTQRDEIEEFTLKQYIIRFKNLLKSSLKQFSYIRIETHEKYKKMIMSLHSRLCNAINYTENCKFLNELLVELNNTPIKDYTDRKYFVNTQVSQCYYNHAPNLKTYIGRDKKTLKNNILYSDDPKNFLQQNIFFQNNINLKRCLLNVENPEELREFLLVYLSE
jgi:hypothetical protein